VTTKTAPAVRLLAAISYARMAAVPVVMALLLLGDENGAYAAAAVIFSLAAATDFIDGFLARRWDVTTVLGAFLDTTADKLLVSGALIALVAVDRVSAWIAIVIVGRELVIMGLRALLAAEGTVLRPSVWGKIKVNVQFVAVLFAILRPADPLGPLFLDEWAMLVAAFVTVVSAVEYFARFSSVLASESRG
jgi:CDP-diacylglycerol--glycerol-3-phosphate 3-phosphatidyltransferase